jgi:hypothetical protein
MGSPYVFVYADGRVISFVDPAPGWAGGPLAAASERRLTPEGVELVRSGAVKAEDLLLSSDAVPADAWEDPEIKPFVPSRYSVCHLRDGDFADPSQVVDFFPPPVRALILELSRGDSTCYDVTTDDARTLGLMLSDVRVGDSTGGIIQTDFTMMLPHGKPAPCSTCG